MDNIPDKFEFSIIDNNIEYKYKIIKTITNIDNKNYIVYKDIGDDIDDNYYVSRYTIDKNKELKLFSVEDNEWDLIDKYL